jgi:hypothetical protein
LGQKRFLFLNSPTANFHQEFQRQFEAEYLREFGFLLRERDLVIDDVRVRVTASSSTLAPPKCRVGANGLSVSTTQCYFARVGFVPTPVYRMSDLALGQRLTGPCLIVDATSTVLLEPETDAEMRETDLLITIRKEEDHMLGRDAKLVDSVLLSVFAHRFMSIAEQMGRTLQRTSVSTNIKERKDFSCALFGPTGGLVANAPHLPVHLGSMSDAIRWQIKHLGDSWKEGYVVCTNHPEAGGTHLPDITVITPVFADDGKVSKRKKKRRTNFFLKNETESCENPFSMSPPVAIMQTLAGFLLDQCLPFRPILKKKVCLFCFCFCFCFVLSLLCFCFFFVCFCFVLSLFCFFFFLSLLLLTSFFLSRRCDSQLLSGEGWRVR